MGRQLAPVSSPVSPELSQVLSFSLPYTPGISCSIMMQGWLGPKALLIPFCAGRWFLCFTTLLLHLEQVLQFQWGGITVAQGFYLTPHTSHHRRPKRHSPCTTSGSWQKELMVWNCCITLAMMSSCCKRTRTCQTANSILASLIHIPIQAIGKDSWQDDIRLFIL